MKQQILQAFQATLIPNSETIKRGTAALGQLSKHQGYCLALMEIIDDGNMNPFLRQAGLAQLKQSIEKRWQPLKFVKAGKEIVLISSAEKAKIREYLLPAFIRCKGDRRFLKLYKSIVTLVVGFDWKQWLPVPDIIQGLPTVECNSVLHFLLAVQTVFQLSLLEERAIFDKLIEAIFPILLELGRRTCPSPTIPPNQTFDLICKCYWKAMHMQLNQYFKAQELEWMTLFKQALSYNNTEFQLTEEKYVIPYYFFHIKKTVTRILCKYYQKHANWRFDKKIEAYGNQFHAKYSETFLQLLCGQLSLPNLAKTHCFCMKSFTALVQFKPQLVDPYSAHLLYSTVLQFLRLTREDQSLATHDPMQFLRKQEDYSMESPNTKMAATDLWTALTSVEENGTGKYTIKNMEFLVAKLEDTNLVEKEMAMYLMCKLRMSLGKNAVIKKHLSSIIYKYIVPELGSQILFLRARAMDIFISYGNMDFDNMDLLQKAVQKIFLCIANDTNALVQIKAACAFNQVLRHHQAMELVKPYLSKILQIYVRLIDKYDLQQLVISLEGIVGHFSKQIGPFAIELTKHLSLLFIKYCKGDLQKIDDRDYNGQLEHAAGGVVMAIKQIIDSKLSPECMAAIQEYVVSIIAYSFTIQGSDYLQDTLKLLNSYLYNAKQPFSARIWFFYPLLIYSMIGAPEKQPLPLPVLMEYQSQLMENMKKPYNNQSFESILPVLCTFINKGLGTIAREKDFYQTNLLELTFKLVEKSFRKLSQDTVMNLVCSTCILVYLLENTRPIGPAIAFIFQVLKFNVENVHSKTLRTMNAQLIANCLFNTPQVLVLFSKDNFCDKIFADLLRYSKFLVEAWQVKRLILGLSSFIVVPNKPQNTKNYVDSMFKLLISKVLDVGRQRFSDQDHQHHDSDEKEDFNDAEDLPLSLESEELYFEQEHQQIYPSRVAEVDELHFFQECLKMVQQNQPQIYADLMKLVSQSQLTELKNILASVKKPQPMKKQ